MECSNCGISGDKARLFDVISKKGIIKICERCSFNENIPIIRKPTTFQLRESERRSTVYERLSRAAGINKEEKNISEKNRELIKKQETTLKDIVDKAYLEKVKAESKPRPDLIDNFHWVIMRARRSKKLTQAQFAKEIYESEIAIKMAEQGVLPEDDNKLISKIESCLGIKLVKKTEPSPQQILYENIEKETIRKIREPTELAFDPVSAKSLRIADIKEMKKKKETGLFGSSNLNSEEEEILEEAEELEEAIEKTSDKRNISQEEIDDLIFGRKSK